MSKVGKIAIGCVLFLFLAGVALIAGLGGLAWWGKGKLQEVAGPAIESAQKISELEQKANQQNPFTRPADRVVTEDRLLKFLEVRKRVFAVYEKNKAFFQAAAERKKADLSDVTRGIGVLGEIRQTLAEALLDVGMNTDEYAFIASSIYHSAWAAGVADAASGKTISEVTGAAVDEVQRQLAATKYPEAEKAARALREQRDAAVAMSQSADVPKANVELFRKHEAEIKQYAMGGLELLGL